MKKNWKAIAITVVAASALVYPAVLLARYIARKRAQNADTEGETHTFKAFVPAFRGKRKHHRTEHNGHPDAGLA